MGRVRGAKAFVVGVVACLIAGGVVAAPALISTASTGATSAAAATTNVTQDQIGRAFGNGSAIVAMANTVREVAVAFVSMNDVTAGQAATVTGGGFVWHLGGRTNAQRGDAEIWWAMTAGKSFGVT